jgi:hypothetical protein
MTDRVAELEATLAAETGRANRMLDLLNRQTSERMKMQQALDRYAIDIPEYRHALGHVMECEDNCEQCRRLAGATLDRTVEAGGDVSPAVTFLHPPWQVQMERNRDGTYDVGLVLAGRTSRMTCQEATTLSVALAVGVESATAPEPELNGAERKSIVTYDPTGLLAVDDASEGPAAANPPAPEDE